MRVSLTVALFAGVALLALAALIEAVATTPPADRAEALVRQAWADGRRDRLHAATTAWKEALARSPGDPLAWTGLAWAEALRGAPAAYVDRLMARAAALGPHVPEVQQARAAWRRMRATVATAAPPTRPPTEPAP